MDETTQALGALAARLDGLQQTLSGLLSDIKVQIAATAEMRAKLEEVGKDLKRLFGRVEKLEEASAPNETEIRDRARQEIEEAQHVRDVDARLARLEQARAAVRGGAWDFAKWLGAAAGGGGVMKLLDWIFGGP